jgi:WD40 repeat protein
MPKPLDDGLSDVYVFPSWSPNNQFLYYTGACGDGSTINCPNVYSLLDQKTIWRVRDNGNRGEFGNMDVRSVIWSPDSNYIAIPILGNQVVIINITTQQEVSRISIDHAVKDVVWIDD